MAFEITTAMKEDDLLGKWFTFGVGLCFVWGLFNTVMLCLGVGALNVAMHDAVNSQITGWAFFFIALAIRSYYFKHY